MASPAVESLTTPRLHQFAETLGLLADLEKLLAQNLILAFEDENGVQRFAVRELP